jgi:hypothetical protein
MNWKDAPAISVNAFAVVTLENGLLRVAFGEGFSPNEESIAHGALSMDRKLLQQALNPPDQGAGGPAGGPAPGWGGPGVVSGSTMQH